MSALTTGALPQPVYVVDAVRTPIARTGTLLARTHPVDLSATVLGALVRRTGIEPHLIDDVYWGCATQIGQQASNIARFAVLAAGWPEAIPGVTLNRACGSGQQAIDSAAHALAAGAVDLVLAGGVESMTAVPLGAARAGADPLGPRVRERFGVDELSTGRAGELVASRWGLERDELDAFALSSHRRAVAASDTVAYGREVLGAEDGFSAENATSGFDNGVRPDASLEALSRLRPAFAADGRLHAGNSSQISDGAAGVVLASGRTVERLGLQPLARYVAGAARGGPTLEMLTAPIAATWLLLDRLGLTVDDVDTFEVNEAFASVPLAWARELHVDLERVNRWGGAIALGHPLGASGAILTARLVHQMRAAGHRLGLQTICEFGGTANASLLELV